MTEDNKDLVFPHKEVEEMKKAHPDKGDLLNAIEVNVIDSLKYLSNVSDVRHEEPIEMLNVSITALIGYIREELWTWGGSYDVSRLWGTSN